MESIWKHRRPKDSKTDPSYDADREDAHDWEASGLISIGEGGEA